MAPPAESDRRPALARALRSIARRASNALDRVPALHGFLKTCFLSLPVAIRGKQMIWDALVELATKRNNDVFVLQVGANDGVHDDPVSRFIRKHHWHALLVEPVPAIFQRLKANYQGVSGVQFANVAISDRDESRPFYFIDDPNHELPPWAGEVGSFIRELVTEEISGRDVRGFIREIEVPCLTPGTLLKQHDVKRVDLVVIDAQGYDDRILLQLPLDSIRPALIIFEHCLLSDDQRSACTNFLKQHGYSIDRDRWDIMATLDSAN